MSISIPHSPQVLDQGGKCGKGKIAPKKGTGMYRRKDALELRIVEISHSIYCYCKNYKVIEKKASDDRPALGFSEAIDGKKILMNKLKNVCYNLLKMNYTYGYIKLTHLLQKL